MKKIAFFGVNTIALNILSNIKNDIHKDLLVTIDEKKAQLTNTIDFRKDLTSFQFNQVYFCDKYSLKSEKDVYFFNEYKGDLGVVIGWNRLIPKLIINSFKYGILGFHGSPYGLPKGRGRSPVVWTLVLGKQTYHYYLFQLTEGIDDGPILSEKILDINEFDDNSSVYKKLSISASEQLNEIVPRIFSKKISCFEQPKGEATYFAARGFEDGKISWDKPTMEIYNLIRAITKPYPCAHTFLNKRIIKIIDAKPFSYTLFPSKEPGNICEVFDDKSFVVKTGDGTLLIKAYEANNKININKILR